MTAHFMSDRPTLASTIAALANQTLTGADRVIVSAGPLETAHPEQLSYMDNAKYLDALRHTRAGVCLVSKRYQSDVPAGTIAIVTDEPYNIYAIALQHLYAGAMIPRSSLTVGGTFEKGAIHPSAAVGAGVIIEPGVVVGPRSRIGDGCYIGANTVIGPDVVTGRNCHVYANVVISFATIGDRVIVHPGAKIGQDGFGFVPRPSGHIKVPQVGSVVIGDDVEIGSNTTVDRGSIKNTVIGRGTKIDNLVQIAHNVVIGSHCIIAAQTGIAGSTVLGDFVMVGGHAAIASHLSIGSLAQIAAASGVMRDIPPRGRYAGIPARPVARFFRQYKTVERLAEQRTRSGDEHPAAD